MRRLRRHAVLALWSLAAIVSPLGVADAAVPTPDAFLGFRVGADRKLADYGQIVRYFEALDQGSDRLTLHRLGKTVLGRDLVMAVISSEANLKDADRYKTIARRLADPRGLGPDEAERLVAEGKVIVLVTCNIHASEIGASQMAMEWAHSLVTSEDPRVRGWLDNVILLLMPSINPDGADMIVDYYRKYLGTEWEGGRLPWLYHHYAGHDNNRDWYMLTLPETRLVNRVLHHDWFPQVFLDEHQMGTTTPRIFVPPYADPHTPLVHPLQWRLNDLIGTAMALRLEQAGKSGVIYSYAYDAYWPGGTKNTACLKNVIGLLTEVSSVRIATPVYVDPAELSGGRKGLPEYTAQMNFPNPWPGGWWRLRDIVDYELVASNSLLETCANYRAEILRSDYEMGKRAVEQGRYEAPFAYVVPPAQHDPAAAMQMIDLLREHGVEARVARAEGTTADGRQFPAGSVVLPAAQPYRPFLVEMMERQRYPEVRQGPDTKEIFKPYDVTAWTLPLLMGVEWARVDQPFSADVEPAAALRWHEAGGTGSRADDAPALLLPAASNESYAVVNQLLAVGVKVERGLDTLRADVGGVQWGFPPGAFVVPRESRAMVEKLAAERKVGLFGLSKSAIGRRSVQRAPRIGMYKSFAASMDEGWTRMVLDRHGFKLTSLDNAAVKAKDLSVRFDVIILPDQDKNVIVDGRPKNEDGPGYFEPLPPPYAGGIGKEGVANLKAFVEAGGTLICLSEACGLALDEFNLPARNLVGRMKSTEYSLPGTLVNLEVDTAQPLAWGMPRTCAAYYTSGPVFATSVPGAGVGRAVVARFPEYADRVVASGWAAGTAHVAGRAAVVQATLGKGSVVLFGPRIQNRGQMLGTFKMLFNAILNATLER
jgi:zinc carboxypeptidase